MSFLISKPCQCRDKRQNRCVLKGMRQISKFEPKDTRLGLLTWGVGVPIVFAALYLTFDVSITSVPDMSDDWWIDLLLVGFFAAVLYSIPVVALACPNCKRLMFIKFGKTAPDTWLQKDFPEPVCPQCGYLLKGVMQAQCPECGHEVPESWFD